VGKCSVELVGAATVSFVYDGKTTGAIVSVPVDGQYGVLINGHRYKPRGKSESVSVGSGEVTVHELELHHAPSGSAGHLSPGGKAGVAIIVIILVGGGAGFLIWRFWDALVACLAGLRAPGLRAQVLLKSDSTSQEASAAAGTFTGEPLPKEGLQG
jgi:hypothetical protein